MKTIVINPESKGGRVRTETIPILDWIITPIYALATFVPPAVYIGALVSNNFRQPEWVAQFALSDEIAGVRLDPAWKDVLRAGACVTGFSLKNLVDNAFYHLGEQCHSLGVRMLFDVRDSPSDLPWFRLPSIAS